MDSESIIDIDVSGVSDGIVSMRLKKSEKKARKIEEYRKRRKENRSGNKREARRKKSEIRHKMLAEMSDDERREFILNEKKENELKRVMIEENLVKSYKSGVVICINCGFEDRMREKEVTSLAKQISMVYNGIKKNMYNMQLHLSHFNEHGMLADKLKYFSPEKWMVYKHERDYWNIYDRKSIIVLSPDATEDLEDVNTECVYIIGGLVDVNNLKNETFIQSITLDLECRRLPLDKYPICKKKVLTIPTVVDILAARLDGRSWEEAFERFIPKNRLYKLPDL